MRLTHFEQLAPICPRCLRRDEVEVPLILGAVVREEPGVIREGTLVCSAPQCGVEYPILDGIPILHADVDEWISANQQDLLQRHDLTPELDGYIGDCLGPGSIFDRSRQFRSSYGYGHFRDLQPDAPPPSEPSVVSLLDRGVERGLTIGGAALDIGCSVGRITFELARRGADLALGVDLNYAMLRMAAEIARTGVVRYPLRRLGLVYDQVEYPVEIAHVDHVDFWAADAALLPFPRDRFSTVTSLNVVDSVAGPHDHLSEIGRSLRPGGEALIAAPYDWNGSVTPVSAWLGGRAQRAFHQGRSEHALTALLTSRMHPVGLELQDELADIPWEVRVHDRSSLRFSTHLVHASAPLRPTRLGNGGVR